MRLSTLVLPLAAFASAAVVSGIAANFCVTFLERASETAVQEKFDEAGLDWASVDAAGLNVFIIGTAQTEADRFRAMSNAGQVVDAARLIDQMDVADAKQLEPPRFSIQILRNESGVQLFGLTPDGDAHLELIEVVQDIVGDEELADLLDSASYPAPENWADAIEFAAVALRRLPQSQISVSADLVEITATTQSPELKARAESTLRRVQPDNLRVVLDIKAPRPVITPFNLRFLIEDGAASFDACSASSQEAADRILSAARAAGMDDPASCIIGLGAPSTRWDEAAEQSIEALAALGGGSVTMADAEISLIAAEGTAPSVFDRIVGALENELPPVFSLTAVLPEPPDPTDTEPVEFVATLSPEGQIQMRGRVASAVARQTAESYAKAAFPGTEVNMTARIDEDLPSTWSVRVLAGLEALATLANGALTVTPSEVRVSGDTGIQDASARISRLFSDKLGEGAKFSIDVTYKESLDPTSDMPTPEECLAQVNSTLGTRKLSFEPGSATLDGEGKGIMDDIADVLKTCPNIPLVIEGHTDSQGREEMNQQLSQSRAEAIVTELSLRRVLTSGFRAVGLGEAEPVADNGTAAGREANRRIEFKLAPANQAEDDESGLASTDQSVEEDGATQAGGSDDGQN